MTPHAPPPSPAPSSAGSSRVAPSRLLAASVGVALIFMAGYVRTHEAAERLTRTSSRPRAAHTADVQQVLDMARFTSVAPVTDAANPAPATAAPSSAPAATPRTTGAVSWPAGVRPAVAASVTAATPPRADAAPEPAPLATAASAATVPATAASAVSMPGEPATASGAPAADTAAPPAPAAAQSPAPFRDGTYTGWGYCRHGEIQATIIVEHGRITSAEITGCYTRYTCDWIAKLPPQVVSRQSAEVDFVSGATESADAFYYAVEDALKKAR
ncbi:MAG: FMN-binding protein [Vicinamibacterales bacterium]